MSPVHSIIYRWKTVASSFIDCYKKERDSTFGRKLVCYKESCSLSWFSLLSKLNRENDDKFSIFPFNF